MLSQVPRAIALLDVVEVPVFGARPCKDVLAEERTAIHLVLVVSLQVQLHVLGEDSQRLSHIVSSSAKVVIFLRLPTLEVHVARKTELHGQVGIEGVRFLPQYLPGRHYAVCIGAQKVQRPQILLAERRMLVDVDRVQLLVAWISPHGRRVNDLGTSEHLEAIEPVQHVLYDDVGAGRASIPLLQKYSHHFD